MLYAAVRPVARIGLKRYFRRIDLADMENIPRKGAVILAANHPTTFIEPCILACYQDAPLHFMARGDFFKHRIAASLLSGVHIIPIFRLKDGGFEGLKNNYGSFERAFDVLAAGKKLMILAEGRCIHEKRLRPIQKGTARIALGALDATTIEEVYIVPVGVNYTYADRLRSDVMIRFGTPIHASEYLATYREAPNQAIVALSDELSARLAQDVIAIEQVADEPLVEHLLQIYRTQFIPQVNGITHDGRQLRGEKQLVANVVALPAVKKEGLRGLCYDYFSRLERMRITDAAFAGKYKKQRAATSRLLWGALPFVVFLLWHLPPLLLAQWIAG
ncbi:MAG: 1-acyl-sn-glycerol-3-phosphate acyltransferase [Saprospiraceae bacterium]